MIARKILLAASAAALLSTPVWALPSQAASSHANSHAFAPPNGNNPGRGHLTPSGPPANHGNSHKCQAHRVGFVVGGTLVSQTLAKNTDGTYTGTVTIKVTHANHHAAKEKTLEKTYSLTSIHVTFGLPDSNSDGTVGLDDVKAGDKVMLIGKITAIAKKCDQSGFTPQTTFRKLVFTS